MIQKVMGHARFMVAAIIAAMFSVWWIVIRPAPSAERAAFVSRTAASSGVTAAAQLQVALQSDHTASLFSMWRLRKDVVSSVQSGPFFMAEPPMLADSSLAPNGEPEVQLEAHP